MGESFKTAPGGVVHDDGVLRITEMDNPRGLAIAGEIDEGTYPALVETLKERAAGAGEFHFDLGGVQYCDLAGLRAIILLVGSQSDRGARRLVLHDVPQQLNAVLRIVGWDATPGLVIE